MTIIDRYINEIKEAGAYLEKHPDWCPEREWLHDLERMNPAKAIGEIVQGLTED